MIRVVSSRRSREAWIAAVFFVVGSAGCDSLSSRDPVRAAQAVAQPYCACQTQRTAHLIDLYGQFQRDFATKNFSRRRTAQDALDAVLKPGAAEPDACTAAANKEHERSRRQFINDRAATEAFESTVAATRAQCVDPKAGELGVLEGGVKSLIAAVTDPDIDVTALLAARGQAGYRATTDADRKWDKYELDTFVTPNRASSPQYPFVVRGDFDGDRIPDTAADVIQISGGRSRLAILWGHGGVTFEDGALCSAISQVAPTTLNSHWEPQPLTLTADALLVECYEKSSYVLYWDGRAFRRYQMTD